MAIDVTSEHPESSGPAAFSGLRPAKMVWCILLLALVVRLGWAVVIHTEPVSDARAYHLLARQLAAGGTYGFDGTPNAFWPVGYPFFLSLHYRSFGEGSWMVTTSAVALGTLTVALTMMLASQWFRDERTAVLAGAVVAVYPVYIQFVTILASEILFTFLLVSGIVCWGNHERFSVRAAFLAGVLLGLASYVRPLALGIVVPLAVARWISTRSVKLVIMESCTVVVVVALMVAPWCARNYRVYGRLIPVSTNGGMCLFFGNNPLVPEEYQSIVKPDFRGDDAAREAYCASEAMRFIRSDWLAFVKRGVRKAIRMWERDTIGAVWNESGIQKVLGSGGVCSVKIASQGFWMLLLLASAVGAIFVVTRLGGRVLLGYPGIWIAMAFTAVYAVTFAQDRYHFPVVALLAPLAAVGVQAAVGGRLRVRQPSGDPLFA